LDLRLLSRLSMLPRIAPECFGERGLQTDATLRGHLKDIGTEPCPSDVALRVGADVREFDAAPPRIAIARSHGSARLRSAADFSAVDVLIRQTARFPIAAPSDGGAFRNSILAGFARPPWSPASLTAYLNATLARWFHYQTFRDAREGMPQVKIAHLRRLPMPPRFATGDRRALEAIASSWDGSCAARERLDDLVFELFDVGDEDRTRVRTWFEGVGAVR
jgi:hypothetical protein